MTDSAVSHFVARNHRSERDATGASPKPSRRSCPSRSRRQRLVGDGTRRDRRQSARRRRTFPELWNGRPSMLTCTATNAYVTKDYAGELSTARGHAGRRGTDRRRSSRAVARRGCQRSATRRCGALDLELLLDLLRIEEEPGEWREVLDRVVAHVNDLVLLGDFESAVPLAQAIAAKRAARAAPDVAPFAAAAVDGSPPGQLMRDGRATCGRSSDEVAELAKALCHDARGRRPSSGAGRSAGRRRARARVPPPDDILVSFGSRGHGRRRAAKLVGQPGRATHRDSPAARVRRQRGAAGARAPLDDKEPNVQREAIRAIVNIGTDEAFAVLETGAREGQRAVARGHQRRARVDRDERAIPLFCHILKTPRGPRARSGRSTKRP